jgi:CRISPR type III-A-associated RAMP protein Csm4
MPLSFVVRFRPAGPWRIGPASGARDRVDPIYHSDALFSAVCGAMLRLGRLDEWLDATARANGGAPAVRFSSLFPFQRDTLFVAPPRGIWPPPASAKVRYKGARFAPLRAVEALFTEKGLDEDRWFVDGESECLVPAGNQHRGPFRSALRSSAAVDRLGEGQVDTHVTACVEFSQDAGLWTRVVFADDEAHGRWGDTVRGAFRLLADSGLGGERSRGWGRSEAPEWETSELLAQQHVEGAETAWWLLSLFAPAEADQVDWKRGAYSTIARSGRVESEAGWGAAKRPTTMIAEGSVLMAAEEPRGAAVDVAPEGFPHPVFRSGFAVAIPIPWRAPV